MAPTDVPEKILNSGPDAGFATLFHHRWCIVTPPPGADPTIVSALVRFWEALGFVPIAFRGGSTKKSRTHIFWQKPIRAEDAAESLHQPVTLLAVYRDSEADGGAGELHQQK